jgi:hypothetical protein
MCTGESPFQDPLVANLSAISARQYQFTKQAYKGPKANGGNTLGGTALYELLRTSTCHPSVLQEKPCLRQVMSLAAVWPPWR